MTDRLSIEGRALEVAWWGERDPGFSSTRVPIVLLHEGLGSIAMWRDTPAAIAEATGNPVLAYSRWGHGQSDPPATPHTVAFMHDEARHELPKVLDACGVTSAILLGHSDGGSIALIFAAMYPERTNGLILEAPHVFVEDIGIASIERMKKRYAETPLRDRLARYHHHVDVAFHGWNDVWLDPRFRDWNLEEFLPRVTCPVLLIQGKDDQYGTLRQIETITAKVSGPTRTLILDDCGHAPHHDRKRAVMDAIAKFVATVN